MVRKKKSNQIMVGRLVVIGSYHDDSGVTGWLAGWGISSRFGCVYRECRVLKKEKFLRKKNENHMSFIYIDVIVFVLTRLE